MLQPVTREQFFTTLYSIDADIMPMPCETVTGGEMITSIWRNVKTRQIFGKTATNGYNKREYFIFNHAKEA